MRLSMPGVYLLSVIVLAACGGQPPAEAATEAPAIEEPGQQSQEILNGDALPGGWAGMVRLTGPWNCSGVLLTNSLVLTARTCIDDGTQPWDQPMDPNKVLPASIHTVTLGGQTRQGSLVLWPGGITDVALIHVDRPFYVGNSTAGFSRAIRSSPVPLYSLVECYGYGANALDSAGNGIGYGTLRHSSNSVTGVFPPYLFIEVNAAGQILTRGDAGGTCFTGQEVAGVASFGDLETQAGLEYGPSFKPWVDELRGRFSNGNDLNNGVLLRDNAGGIHVVMGGAPLHIPTLAEFYERWANYGPMYQTGPMTMPAVPRDGTLLRDPNGEIDVFYGGARFPIPSLQELQALGLSTANVLPAPTGSFFHMPRVPRDGVALVERGTTEINVIEGGRRYRVVNETTYQLEYSSWPLYRIPSGGLSAIPYGGIIR